MDVKVVSTFFFSFLLSTVRPGDHQGHVPGEVRRVSEGRPEGRVQRRLQAPPPRHLPLRAGTDVDDGGRDSRICSY